MAFNVVAGMLCLLLLGQFMVARLDQGKLNEYAGTLMQRANDVALQSQEAIDEANLLAAEPCSDADLFQLRFMVYKYGFLLDIGRVRDGRLICSAGRGRLSAPVSLPPPNLRTEGGVLLWRATRGLVDPRIQMDIASQYDIAVFTSPDAFHSFSFPVPGYSALLTTSDGRHVYQSFGMPEGQYSRQPSAWYRHYRLAFQCSEIYDICTYVRHDASGIFSLPWHLYVAILLLGGLLGGSLSLAAILLIDRNRSMSKQVYSAVYGNQLHVNYQPLICLHNDRIIGVEVLSRWINKKGENIPPDIFIPLAEELGIIGEITRQATRMALEELRDVLIGNRTFYLSINIDITDVLDPAFQCYLNQLVQRCGVSRQQIMLEITERSTADYRDLSERLTALHEEGYRVALDDFGTGYSNLSYLTVMPFDAIKIDRMFTGAIGTDSVNAQMVELLFTLTAMFKSTVIVEGIETPEQADWVRRHCPGAVGQGWHFGRPMSGPRLRETFMLPAASA
ncbi:EAL domain-containing protein [Affinibrenneria salicis]|nr:EAL domain-containing protein [Affinibrenneria salicis]